MPIQVVKERKTTPLRHIVELRMQGLSQLEIAKKLGVSKQAISKRLQGALAKIDGDVLEAYRPHKIAVLESIEQWLLSALVDDTRLKKATLGNVAYAFTQIHQARRLESGESTSNLSLAAIVASIEADGRSSKKERVSD